MTRCLEADNKLVTGTILRRLFTPATELNDWNHTCYPLWNADGMSASALSWENVPRRPYPLPNLGVNSYRQQDIEVMIRHVKEHGYGTQPGSQFLIFAHPDDVDAATMTAWRAGVEYRTGGPLPRWDFIPSALMPAWISDEQVHGPVPNADFNGLQVWGTYAGALLIQSNFVPKGYVAVVATNGPNSDLNPVGVREHTNAAYQGLRHIPGSQNGYPLQDSFFARGFGVGTRHRGAAICIQITTGGTYTAPTTIAV